MRVRTAVVVIIDVNVNLSIYPATSNLPTLATLGVGLIKESKKGRQAAPNIGQRECYLIKTLT
ncbi:hypothetical protein GCM10009022_13730 [Vreelandella titanicae]